MRAKGALAVFCVLFGTTALVPVADATERTTRRAVQPVSVQPAVPVARSQAARPAPAPRGSSTTARRQAAADAPRSAAIRPADSRAPLRFASLGIVRSASARSAGTPIRPVNATGYLSCVPFARMATGMDIRGDARLWWNNAAGSYDRGQRPERGSVLAFAASGGMTRGHVAVVSRVVDARTIEIDHSNWAGPGIRRGTVMRGVVVVDASDRNDWSAVRVQVGHDDRVFGRTYRTYGFIYNRAPNGTPMMTAEAGRYQEVAEAPSPHVEQHQRLTAQLFGQ
jgi:hypothetical protein